MRRARIFFAGAPFALSARGRKGVERRTRLAPEMREPKRGRIRTDMEDNGYDVSGLPQP